MGRATLEREQRRDAPSVLRWRFDRLMEAGYEAGAGSLLAKRIDVDLHEAIRLVRLGCPPETAVRILV